MPLLLPKVLLIASRVNEVLVYGKRIVEELIRVRIKSIQIGPFFIWTGRIWQPHSGSVLECFREERTTHD
jgi:hypothetical protein